MYSREEEVLVLYGSQRGNAGKLALEIAERLPNELGAEIEIIQTTADNNDDNDCPMITIVPKLMTLDEFIKDGSKWTRLVVIVTSSFGSGDAPMNARKFRKACDGWIQDFKRGKRSNKFLEGMHFALMGYGDSFYKTFQKNPMVLEQALTTAGATLVGERGVTDFDKEEDEQKKAISEWLDSLWSNLAKIVIKEPLSEEVLAEMQHQTELSS